MQHPVISGTVRRKDLHKGAPLKTPRKQLIALRVKFNHVLIQSPRLFKKTVKTKRQSACTHEASSPLGDDKSVASKEINEITASCNCYECSVLQMKQTKARILISGPTFGRLEKKDLFIFFHLFISSTSS